MFQLGGADPPPAAPAPSSQSFSFPPDSPNPPRFLTPAVNRFHDYCTVNPINVFLFFFPLLFLWTFLPSPPSLSLHSSSSAIRYSFPRGAVSHLWNFFNHLCVVMLLCPVVLWEDVIWELCSAEPGTEKCHPPKRKKKKIGQGKEKKSDGKKQDLAKVQRFFSLGSSPGFTGDVHGGEFWSLDVFSGGAKPAQGVQPAPGSGWVWTAITME